LQFSQSDRARLFKHRKIEAGPEPTACWLWTGCLRDHRGYGSIRASGRTFAPHVMSYLIHKGPVPKGLELDHLCHVPRCFNPEHLEPVTHTENMLRGRSPNLEKETCLRGHPYHYRFRASTGRLRRDCRTCINAAQKKRYHESKAEPGD